MTSHRVGALLSTLLALAACAGPDKPPAPPPATPATPIAGSPPSSSSPTASPLPAPQKLDADSPRTTARGATFVAPAGWTLQSHDQSTVLIGPESDLRVAIVDSGLADADQAVAAAWRALRPDFKRPVKLVTPQPGRDGWDARRNYDYETSPNEKVVAWAFALQHGDTWIAAAIESGQASFEKRRAALLLISKSLRPQGYVKESFAGRSAQKLDAQRVKLLTDFVDHGRQTLSLPGVAIALVQDDRVVFQGGFGVRELGRPTKVDANTLFMIASNTKALATLLLAMEVDQGKFTWDTPVTEVFPTFRLGNEETTRKVLMKHLVCACTGLPRQDLEWLFEYQHVTPQGELALLGTMQPTTAFGETFQYSNLMASAAGFIGGHVAYPTSELGAAFDHAMKVKVFQPLGMTATTFDFARALATNHATPHGPDIDGHMAIAAMDINRSIVPARPAGGAWSSAADLIKYVQLELRKGALPGGKPLLREQCLMDRRTPQVSVGEDRTYGMGLMVETQYGITLVHHGGDMIGFHSDMFWLPDYGVGGVILTNGDGGWLLRRPFMRRVLEVLFDGHPEADEDLLAEARSRAAEIGKARERLIVPPAATAVARLAPHYHNDALGEIHVMHKGSKLVFDFDEWRSAVASRQNDDGTTSMMTIDPGVAGDDGFEFVITDHAGKRALVLRDMQHEYEFVEAP